MHADTPQSAAAATPSSPETGAEDVRWQLDDLYSGLDDPALEADLQTVVRQSKAYHEKHQGKLHLTLGEALADESEISTRVDQLMVYLFLRRSTDTTDADIEAAIGRVQETLARTDADYMNFFAHELAAMAPEAYDKALAADENAQRHRSLLDHIRANRDHLLDEPIERALTLRRPFGASEWSDYIDEVESELVFEMEGESLRLPEILHRLSNDPDAERRASALAVFAKGLRGQKFDRLMARTLNVVLGAKSVEDRERGYASPMSSRNIGNRVDDDTVEALHKAVAEEGAAQCRRYYQLLSRHLGISPLRWSDRNAQLPSAEQRLIPWQECVDTVLAAYGSFSETLRDRVQHMIDRRWVDAPPGPGKTGGAFNYSVLLPGDRAQSYMFLNYLGSPRDVMTVAHEAGHGVHGLLAAQSQGALMFRAPMAYAETASIFGEMTTFRYLLERCESDEQKLSLLMDKCSDHVNSVVRQISFSNFERRAHDARRTGKLKVEDFERMWMDVTREFYGPDGELFTYENVEPLWCYVTHFLRPFYVYAYAFGELFTQSLYSVKDQFGADFEPMYLDLLRAGGSKNAIELLEPFGLDPRDDGFWRDGIRGSLGAWLDQAEALTARVKPSS